MKLRAGLSQRFESITADLKKRCPWLWTKPLGDRPRSTVALGMILGGSIVVACLMTWLVTKYQNRSAVFSTQSNVDSDANGLIRR